MTLKKYVFNIYVSSFNDKVLLVKKKGGKKMLKKIFSLFVCAMMCLISTNLVFADGTSYYQESLHELIAAYKEKVGAKKLF